jgi:hypothetical protein
VQAIVKPSLRTNLTEPLFNPSETMERFWQQQRRDPKTRAKPYELKRA